MLLLVVPRLLPQFDKLGLDGRGYVLDALLQQVLFSKTLIQHKFRARKIHVAELDLSDHVREWSKGLVWMEKKAVNREAVHSAFNFIKGKLVCPLHGISQQ